MQLKLKEARFCARTHDIKAAHRALLALGFRTQVRCACVWAHEAAHFANSKERVAPLDTMHADAVLAGPACIARPPTCRRWSSRAGSCISGASGNAQNGRRPFWPTLARACSTRCRARGATYRCARQRALDRLAPGVRELDWNWKGLQAPWCHIACPACARAAQTPYLRAAHGHLSLHPLAVDGGPRGARCVTSSLLDLTRR